MIRRAFMLTNFSKAAIPHPQIGIVDESAGIEVLRCLHLPRELLDPHLTLHRT
jgi:hypothetical protein